MTSDRQHGWRQGFTLVETLVVTAIVVILLGISAVGVVHFSRWLKIMELDNAAREIYLAAENQAVLLSGSGKLESMAASPAWASKKIELWELDDGTTVYGYYTYSGDETTVLLPLENIDPALAEGRFYIVYEPKSGSVTDVFYAESEMPAAKENFQTFYKEARIATRSERMNMDPMVGYYGSGTAENARDDALGSPIVTIKNEETLKAEITYAVLPSLKDKTTLTVKLNYGGCEVGIPLDYAELTQEEKDGRVRFCYTIVLDSLSGKHFSKLFASVGAAPSSFGGDFTVTATLTAGGAMPSSGSATDNSLFAEGSGYDTAYIANLRHLQNLNESTSKVDGKTKAVQKNDIDCATYLESSYTFTPIQNEKLASYDGGGFELRGLHAEAEGGGAQPNAGLFARVSGTLSKPWEFKNIRIVNASAKANDAGCAGALAGSAEYAVFENCWVYWEPETGITSLRSVLGDESSSYRYKITGGSAGGLAGQLTESSILDCLAATLVKGQEAGGLAGTADGTVSVIGSYADCYLSGISAGGLAGTAVNLNVKNCYAAGFIEVAGLYGIGAGLCPTGSVEAQSVYSVVRRTNEMGNWTPLAFTLAGLNYYYLQPALGEGDTAHARTYTQMTAYGFVGELNGEGFVRKDSWSSHPYNLRTDLALTVYELPGLEKLPHYGDWSAQFTEASLVYYEQYSGASYGFYGGGVDILKNAQPVKDGYAIAIREDSLEGSLTIKMNGGEYTYNAGSLYTVTAAGVTYLLAPLPDYLIDNNAASEQFYQKLSFTIKDASRYYYYCPHFAKTAVKVDTETDRQPPLPAEVSVRTPRHLYMLSRHKEYYNGTYTFRQELDLDYQIYTGYGLFSADFTQTPVGSYDAPFRGVYDGGCHTIKNLAFKADAAKDYAGLYGYYAGLFGYSAGTLRNIVYIMDENRQNTVSLGNYNNLYIGGLAGGNAGSIVNCAVAGVSLTGNAYTATVYIGGLVGLNRGDISGCGTECAALAADTSSYAHAYVGGLAALNQSSGLISASYAVGRASAVADTSSDARVCGFVGFNQGLILNSYVAMDLVSSGKNVETYGFCGVTSGSQSGTFFLNTGNFTYRNVSFNASYTPVGASGIIYAELTNRGAASQVKGMSFINGEGFPYPTAVRDASGNPIHYGLYPKQTELGVMGVYYWEKLEIEGRNPTYHLSLLAVDSNKNTITRQTTLSNAHVDNGVVTDYGYGYYYEAPKDSSIAVGLTTADISYSAKYGEAGSPFTVNSGNEAEDANIALAALMPGYTFHSYHSYGMGKDGGGLYPTGDYENAASGSQTRKPNSTFTLSQGSIKVNFTVNPHFANALSVTLPDGSWTLAGGASAFVPGSENNPYEVRTVSQLQNINWCCGGNTTGASINTPVTVANYASFPYLSHSGSTGKYYWHQTHDLKGESTDAPFSPIAEYYDKTVDNQGNLSGWFGGTYDGDDYVIENVNIQGHESSCAGLFGVVYNGKLKSIILYSSDGQGKVASISGNTDSCWYAIGALAGIAASDSASAIENCTVAGYQVLADMKLSTSKWGGAEIGGLVGISNMDLQNCAAITTVDISGEVGTGKDNMRIGGLVGASQKAIINCYVGGKIRLDDGIANDTDNEILGIYIGGIVGGSYFKPLLPNGGSLIGDVGSDMMENGVISAKDTTNNKIENCYSYVTLPKRNESNNKKIKALYVLGGTGEINSADEARKAWDYAANHGTCTIINSYYLKSVKPADTDGIKTDVNGTLGLTALTYTQLAGEDIIIDEEKIYDRLKKFSPVTALTDDGFSVAGKYSYPSGENLKGLNYPFPTILTRENGLYHVHYGDWPLNGIKRELGGAPIELDMFTKLTVTETLGLEEVEPGGEWKVEAEPVNTGETDENGEPVTKEIVAAKVGQDGELTVEALGVGVTTVTVTYTKDGVDYTLSLSVNVTAVLELRTEDSPVKMFTDGTVGVKLTAYGKRDSEGSEQVLDLAGLTIAASVETYDENILKEAKMGDDLTLYLATGNAVGDTTVSLSYTYTYNEVEYTGLSAITFRVTEPEIKSDEEGNKRTVTFTDAKIDDFQVTADGALGESGCKLEFDKENGKFTLDMDTIPPGTAVIVKAQLILNGRRHEVTVTIPGDEQAGGEGEPGGTVIELTDGETRNFDFADMETVDGWSVISTDDEIATVKITDGKLTVTAVGIGTTMLTMTYTNDTIVYIRLLSVNVIGNQDVSGNEAVNQDVSGNEADNQSGPDDESENPAELGGENEDPAELGGENENPDEPGSEAEDPVESGIEAVIPTKTDGEDEAQDETGDEDGNQDEFGNEDLNSDEPDSGGETDE